MKILFTDPWDETIFAHDVDFTKYICAGIHKDGFIFKTDNNGDMIMLVTGKNCGKCFLTNQSNFEYIECFDDVNKANEFLKIICTGDL